MSTEEFVILFALLGPTLALGIGLLLKLLGWWPLKEDESHDS